MTTRCLPIRGDELARLLAPIDTTTFATDYWGRRPLHIRGGADRYAGLFGRDAFFRAVASGKDRPQHRDHVFLVRNAGLASGKARVLKDLGPFHGRGQPLPELFG